MSFNITAVYCEINFIKIRAVHIKMHYEAVFVFVSRRVVAYMLSVCSFSVFFLACFFFFHITAMLRLTSSESSL